MDLFNLLSKMMFIFFVVLSFKVSADNALSLTNLRTEYKTNPLGIDVLKPRLSWEIQSDKRNTMQTAYEIRFASNPDLLKSSESLLWQSKVNTDQSIHVVYEDPALQSGQRVYWQVKVWDNHGRNSGWSDPAFWEMGLLIAGDWKAAWIEADIEEDTKKSQPAQYFRKEFDLSKQIKSARLYITSHGLYEGFLNEKRVGDQVFTPGWTSYNKQLQYQVYDVSDLLVQGKNALGITVGDGWYRGYLGWKDNRNVYGEKLAVLAQLDVTFEDGSREKVVTDDSWKVTNNGPIRMSDIYMGETYDARKELSGWAKSGFNDSNWNTVNEMNFSKKHLVAPYGSPVRKIEEIKPIGVTASKDNKYILDMGQNMVGWLRIKITGQKGTEIIIRHTEALDRQGGFYTENLRSAKQTVVYICRGEGEEIFEPHFTFQGFRFVEITGYQGTPDLESITGIVIHSDMAPTGNFSCSNELINQLQHNILWGLKGNFLDVPTDCPQRDERMGWTGDAQVFAPTACFNMDAATFYTKWMQDLALDQHDNGMVADVIPNVLGSDNGGHTGWADAAIVVPWTVYLNYGDKRILQDQYKSMTTWINFMKEKAGEDHLWDGDWHYGDWLSFDDSSPAYMGAYTETDLIATAYFAYSTTLMSKIARILDKDEDAKEYDSLSRKIKEAFNQEFLTPNGRLVSHTQTAYTLALAMDLIPENLREKVTKNFHKNVDTFKHITTGFLGTPLISQTLTDNGYLDMAYLLLNRKEYPSWLYPVTMGATTIWERWDGIKPDSTFQDAGMNSLNHYAYGAIGKWLYSTVAGIDIDEENPGYKNILIRPQPGGGLTHATAEIKTMYGLAASAWKFEEDQESFEVTIPPNTTATVYLPFEDMKNVRSDGKLISESQEMVISYDTAKKPFLKLGSGSYKFDYLKK
jgi:alpha-L-rhamnosidase